MTIISIGTCPNDCSGHGQCVTIKDLSLFDGPDYDNAVQFAGDGIGLEYTNWDKNSITICNCDASYFGPDCSWGMLIYSNSGTTSFITIFLNLI